jgi:hypothetical protein
LARSSPHREGFRVPGRLVSVGDKGPTNSELRLLRLEAEESRLDETKGILIIFEPNEDAPLARDDSE